MWPILCLLTLGGVLCYLAMHGPKSNLVHQSNSLAEINNLQTFLEENGIPSFVKSGAPVDRLGPAHRFPTLHLVRSEDMPRASELVRDYLEKNSWAHGVPETSKTTTRWTG